MTIDCQTKYDIFDATLAALRASVDVYQADLDAYNRSLHDTPQEKLPQQEELDTVRGKQRAIIIPSPESDTHDNAVATRALKALRVREAQKILKAFQGVPRECVCDVVQIGALVEVQYQDSDRPDVYIIAATGATRQFNINEGCSFRSVNPTTPIGQALLGRHAGETVVAKTPGGDRTLNILAVI